MPAPGGLAAGMTISCQTSPVGRPDPAPRFPVSFTTPIGGNGEWPARPDWSPPDSNLLPWSPSKERTPGRIARGSSLQNQ